MELSHQIASFADLYNHTAMGNTTGHYNITALRHSGLTTENPCSVYDPTPSLEIRFYLIGVTGFSICLIGIIFNVILLKILLQPALRTTYLTYLSALAVIDINIAVTYIVVMSLATWYEYFNSYLLYVIWHRCLPYFFTLSRVATLASSYLIVACTVERYLEVMQLYAHRTFVRITHTKRYVVIACVLSASTAFRLVVFWEIDVVPNPVCAGTFSYYDLRRTWLVNDFYYAKVYTFYGLHIIQVFFPFVALLLLNMLIVRKWRIVLRRDTVHNQSIKLDTNHKLSIQHQLANGDRGGGDSSEKEEIWKRVKCAQSARVMMIAIVTSYLLCNLLNLILTFFEHLNGELLEEYGDFYSFASDTVTLLTVVNATVRLPIYYASNLKIRSEVAKMFRECVLGNTGLLGSHRRRFTGCILRRNQQVSHDDFADYREPEVEPDVESDFNGDGETSEVAPLCEDIKMNCSNGRVVEENEAAL